MNGMSCNDLCCLFCCPPMPSRIAAKLAFLPPEPSYSLIADASGHHFSLHFNDRSEWQYGEREKQTIDVFTARTSKGNRIACMHVRCVADSRLTLLFSHGNAVDLGQMASFFVGLGGRLGINIFSYDYSGYGVSTGKPLEANLYADIECAWHQLRNRYYLMPENIVLYGQSIGTVPTIDLASRFEVGGVVLHSPLMSGMRVAFPDTQRTYCFDAFPNIDKVPRIQSPCLVIHGTEDEVIDFSHGLTIYESLPKPVDPLWVEGAGHNDIEQWPQYLERLKNFLFDELSRLGKKSLAGRMAAAAAVATAATAVPSAVTTIPVVVISAPTSAEEIVSPTAADAEEKKEANFEDNCSVVDVG